MAAQRQAKSAHGSEFTIKDDVCVVLRLDWTDAGKHAEQLAVQRQAFRLIEPRSLTIGPIAGLAIIPILLVGVVSGVGTVKFPYWALVGVAGAVGLVISVVFRRQYQKQFESQRERLVSFLSGRGLCAACMYDLTASVGNEGEQTQCPECGACWRSERFSTVEPVRGGEDDPGGVPPEVRFGKAVFRELSRPRSSQVNDDRGVVMGLLAITWREARVLARSDRHDERIQSLKRAVAPLGRVRRWLVIGVLLVFGVLAVAAVFPAVFRGGQLLRLIPLVVLPLSASIFIVRLARGTYFANGNRIKELALEREVCPACLADLADVQQEEDGCRVCRVCAAAWRIPVKSDAPYDGVGRLDAGSS